MNRFFLTALICCAPMIGEAAPGGGFGGGPGLSPGVGGKKRVIVRTARQLAQTLNAIASDARVVARRARLNGRYKRARKFRTLAWNASAIPFELRRLVIRPLLNGVPIRKVRQNFASLGYEFQQLRDSVQNIFFMPPALERKIQKGKQLRRQLRNLLRGFQPGPGPGPGPGPLRFKCFASDNGWEEHGSRAHAGYGRTRLQAERDAIRVCERSHGSCHVTSCVVH